MQLFGATTIIRKIILEGGLVAIDNGSGSGVAVGANDALLTVFETTSHYDYDHTDCTDFSPDFATYSECSACKCQYSEATAKKHNITLYNPSTTSKEEEKVELVSLGEQKNYPFEGFNISDEALKKQTKLINDYSEWIADGLLKHYVGRYYEKQPEVSGNEECLIDIIKDFSNPVGLPWHLVDKVYIPINCGDEFYWVLAVVILNERRI
ncbi:hypothetical protein T459_26059 [Capsicum annuum]|uniref:Ubiquitin-like protease family profile domain-containing protein n=1 Tax=Capsicum annuum TaxID=4072 RepID=A0A2G2YMN2_CAPAN|nr:hypothetical protein T459_26059 [Capsicum annuum]